MKSIWKIIRIVFIVIGAAVLMAAVKLALSGYELQVSGIKNQVIAIRFDRTNKGATWQILLLLKSIRCLISKGRKKSWTISALIPSMMPVLQLCKRHWQ